MFGRTGELAPGFDMKGELNPMFGEKRPDLSERNRKRRGELHPNFGKKFPSIPTAMKRRTGELHPLFGRKNPALSERNRTQIRTGELNPMSGKTGELNPSYGKKWWVSPEGECRFDKEPPGPGWQRGRKWKVG
jgi:hypothetical protein